MKLLDCPECDSDLINVDSSREMRVSQVTCSDCGYQIQKSVNEESIASSWNNLVKLRKLEIRKPKGGRPDGLPEIRTMVTSSGGYAGYETSIGDPDAFEKFASGLINDLKQQLAAAPTPPEQDAVVSVTQEDANNYCRILALLGLEEEGDPVAEVEKLLSGPPAQEAEPVATLTGHTTGGYAYIKFLDESKPLMKLGANLYTHAPSDKLRQAAEELVRTFDRIKCLESRYGPCPVVEDLRAELEGKS